MEVEILDAIDASGTVEVEPGRWVHIVAYGCAAHDGSVPVCSDEHQTVRFVAVDRLGDLQLPGAYRQAIHASITPENERASDAGLAGKLSELSVALELADIADDLAMARFGAADLAVDTKSDGSPVTDADVEIEHALRARLGLDRPNHEVVGEEQGSQGSSDWRWYLDPIDGTSRFAAGDPRWYTFVALARRSEVMVAVASGPALGTRWWAVRGAGAFRNGERLAVSTTETLAEATVNDDWRETLRHGIGGRPLSMIARRAARVRPHDGHSYLAVAGGDGEVAAGIGGGPWDYAAVKLIVEEAGGRFSDLDGRDSFVSGHALVTNGLVHQEAIAAVAQADNVL